MKTTSQLITSKKKYQIIVLQLICLLCSQIVLVAQQNNCNAANLDDFFNCYGGASEFSDHSINAITAFIQAEDAIASGNYAEAKTLIENIFTTYPKGNNMWWNVFNNTNGSNIGSPNGYYGLRMIEEIADYNLNKDQNTVAKKAYMKIVLVGCSEGIQPTTETELQNGTGPFVTNTIDTSVKQNDYRIVRQSIDLFSKYITAATQGKIELEIEIIELPNLCMPVDVTSTTPYIASGSIQPVWDTLSDEIKESTDWWWIVYPSHVPEFVAFDDESFITGGMGLDEKGGPAFIVDDKWIVRKPAHLGEGNYSDIERRAYLPQWFQHEFFHHLYRAYPELELEVNGHDWFNRSFWPSDFDGQFEPDFYTESLHKRLQIDCIPFTKTLITRINDEALDQLNTMAVDELIGTYSLDVVENDFHVGDIIKQGTTYFWKNNANVQWEVTPNLSSGKLETGADSPYPGKDFFIELYQNYNADYIPGITGLQFNGGFYRKRFNLLRESIPEEIILGDYQRTPVNYVTHTGNIIKEGGQFFWKNDAGDKWSVLPDAVNEVLNHTNDSPTPNKNFELIIIEDSCGIYIQGFKYLEDYYWKPKRDQSNGSPIITNQTPDLELEQNFGSYVIDLSSAFSDPENNSLSLYASSSNADLISTTINNQLLTLNGNELGNYTILINAIDANGGLVVDEFRVDVVETLSNNDIESTDTHISFFPNPTQDYIAMIGELSNYTITVSSALHSFKPETFQNGNEIKIDLSNLSSGIYFITISDLTTGNKKTKKVVRH